MRTGLARTHAAGDLPGSLAVRWRIPEIHTCQGSLPCDAPPTLRQQIPDAPSGKGCSHHAVRPNRPSGLACVRTVVGRTPEAPASERHRSGRPSTVGDRRRCPRLGVGLSECALRQRQRGGRAGSNRCLRNPGRPVRTLAGPPAGTGNRCARPPAPIEGRQERWGGMSSIAPVATAMNWTASASAHRSLLFG